MTGQARNRSRCMRKPSALRTLALASVFVACGGAVAQVQSSRVRYDLVDRKGIELHTTQADPRHGMFLRRTRPDGSVADFRMPEFDRMRKQHDFEFELVDGSLLQAPRGDYVVLRAMRSIAWNPEEDADYVAHRSWREHRCGHAVEMTFLVAVIANAARIVKRDPVACGSAIRVLDAGGRKGYETTHRVGGADNTVLYLLQDNGSFIEKNNGPSR